MSTPLTKHVSEDAWIDFIEDRVSPATAAQINAHLKTNCAQCIRQLAYWQKMLGAFERNSASTPPPSVLQRAYDLFQERAPQPSVWEQIMASLVLDSRSNMMLAGARASTHLSFNLVFEAGNQSISLWCESDGNSWQITGQILPSGFFWMVMAKSGSNEAQCDLESDGEFRLDLTPGRYDLTIRGTEQEIVIPGLELEAL